ncbi:electron transfer flavo protein alpha-subunit [Aspergillus steynii IBT 23096]|uniref:Probable electron transfer flavoprotein subunit alpha, mitochondrial n=1 Tax=Aspergillus steynii IBT 23096 TaxID=1392250 RepID=A0A2I2FZJ2_9EURO|nr:electron transfer flavo protein alpha-subunit [Aspergillus steynii IBT 23096]PLB46057.1 electron transfer flavo protein alpha-subunit [Aspergillus steynii IBT 23096]
MPSSTAVTTKVTSGSPYQLDNTQVTRASSALLKHIKSSQEEKEKSATKKTLIGDNDGDSDEEDSPMHNEAIWLVLTTKKHVVDKNRLKPGKISIPHSLNASSSLSVCLITADPQRAVKNIVADSSFPQHLSSRIDKSFESRRQLLSEHDVFLADDRIVMRLSSKRPIPIRIAEIEKVDGKKVKKDPKQKSKEDDSAFASPAIVAKEIEKALSCAAVHLAPATTAAIRVGNSKFTSQQLAENVDAVVKGLTEKFITKGWRNIKALHVKGANTMAMPIWLASELWVDEADVVEQAPEDETKAIEGGKNKKRKQSGEEEKQLEAPKKNKKSKATEDDDDNAAARKEKLQKQKAKALEDGKEPAAGAGKKKRNGVLILFYLLSSHSPTMIPIARHSALRAVRSQLRPRAFNQPAASALARLLSTLAVLEQRGGKLENSSLSAIAAAQKLGGPVTAFVAGNNVKGTSAAEAAKIKGLDKVVAVDNEAYEKGLPENYAPLLVENIKKGEFTHIIGGHSAFGKSLLPRVAALLDVQQISDITSIESEDTFVRPIYAGNAILTVQSTDPTKVITVRGTAFQGVETEGGSAEIVEGADPKAPAQTEWVSEELAKSERPDLATASRVVSGGRGLKSKEEFDRVIVPLADSLGAAIGASRAAVDSGFADNSLQVGQTGKNVAPQLYLCAGISGAIQHLAGMKDSKVIAAINKDPDAPIFQVADVGLVGDLFDKVPELTEKLKSQ